MLKARFMAAAATVATAALMGAPAVSEAAAPNCTTAQLIVPWGAGGDTDIIFRTYVDSINKSGIKPQLQVVNVGGHGCQQYGHDEVLRFSLSRTSRQAD
jgi:tripartite-type tricarboxylate transporter receptor subunit TctC